MYRHHLSGFPKATKQRIDRRQSRPVAERSTRGGLHPLLRLQRAIGNLAVGRLIHSSLANEQRPLTRGWTPTDRRHKKLIGRKDDAGDTSEKFDRRDRVAAQSMVAVLRGRSPNRPDFGDFNVQLRPEHEQTILLLWSAATGQSSLDASMLTIPERHEALASGMRVALRLADRYAAAEEFGRTVRVELRDALQQVRQDLYAAGDKPSFRNAFSFGFTPRILDIGKEPQHAKVGSPLSDQPAELREVVYLSFPSRSTPKEPEQWFHDLTGRQKAAFTALYDALRAKNLMRFMHTIHSIDNGEVHFWGLEQEGSTVSLKVIGDSDGLNQRLGDPETQGEISLDSPFMAMMHKGQKSYRERTSGPGLHISVGPGKFWDVHLDAHPPVRGREAESDADFTTRFLLHGLQELFPNMPRTGLAYLLKKIRVPPDIAKAIATRALPAVRFLPATDSPLWRANDPAAVQSLDIQSLKQEGKQMTATVGISTRF